MNLIAIEQRPQFSSAILSSAIALSAIVIPPYLSLNKRKKVEFLSPQYFLEREHLSFLRVRIKSKTHIYIHKHNGQNKYKNKHIPARYIHIHIHTYV